MTNKTRISVPDLAVGDVIRYHGRRGSKVVGTIAGFRYDPREYKRFIGNDRFIVDFTDGSWTWVSGAGSVERAA